MSRHFSATVLLSRPWTLDIDRLADAVRTRFPAIGKVEPLPGRAGAVAGAEATGVLTVDGAQVVVQSLRGPGAPDEMRPGLRTLGIWDPTTALRTHRARLTVSCGGSMPGLVAAEAYGTATHLVAACAAGLAPASAIFWQHGWTFSRREDFDEAAAGLVAGRMPVDAWIGFAPVVPRGYKAEAATGMVTYGLRQMIGRELELAPRPADPENALVCLRGIARRILDRSLELRDGERVRSPGAPDLDVRARTFWLRRDESAFVLVAEDSVVDRDTLRPRERSAA